MGACWFSVFLVFYVVDSVHRKDRKDHKDFVGLTKPSKILAMVAVMIVKPSANICVTCASKLSAK